MHACIWYMCLICANCCKIKPKQTMQWYAMQCMHIEIYHILFTILYILSIYVFHWPMICHVLVHVVPKRWRPCDRRSSMLNLRPRCIHVHWQPLSELLEDSLNLWGDGGIPARKECDIDTQSSPYHFRNIDKDSRINLQYWVHKLLISYFQMLCKTSWNQSSVLVWCWSL